LGTHYRLINFYIRCLGYSLFITCGHLTCPLHEETQTQKNPTIGTSNKGC